MNLKSFFILVVAALLFSACESSVTDSFPIIDQSTSLEYNGGLNVTFDNDIEEFNKSARVVHQETNSYILDLQMSVKTKDDSKRQQATLQLDIPFNSENGVFPVGNYVFNSSDLRAAFGDYKMDKNSGDFARYNFQGKSATLVVEESNTKYIKGSLILNLEQLSGERMIDGQLENVILNSPIRLLSRFDLKY